MKNGLSVLSLRRGVWLEILLIFGLSLLYGIIIQIKPTVHEKISDKGYMKSVLNGFLSGSVKNKIVPNKGTGKNLVKILKIIAAVAYLRLWRKEAQIISTPIKKAAP